MYSWEHQSCSDPTDDCYYSCHGCEVSYVFNTRNYTELELTFLTLMELQNVLAVL